MPDIHVKMGKGQAGTAQKKELIQRLTATASEITQIPQTSFVVFIDEYDMENIGVGGEVLAEKFAKK